MKTIKIGSRESVLAVKQSQIVIDKIRQYDPDIKCELVTMKTTGDRILHKSLSKVGGKGLFTKELDIALINGEIDIAVHSAKDLPTELPRELPLVGFSCREDVRDVFILPENTQEIVGDKPIGTSSKRREHQLRELYPDRDIQSIRGNVQTRIKKLDSGQYSAIILAAAGVKRLGMENRISKYFTTEEILPAACQGIIAVQTREGEDTAYLEKFRDYESQMCALAERAFVSALEGNCTSPIGAYSRVEEGKIFMEGLYVPQDGKIIRQSISGEPDNYLELGRELAKLILHRY